MTQVDDYLTFLEGKLDCTFFTYQREAIAAAFEDDSSGCAPNRRRRCLYYKTGAGKTLTALAMVQAWNAGFGDVLVIAPPSTHAAWKEQAKQFDFNVDTVSHAKFRQKDFKISRTTTVIADEFHLFGGHNGKGWVKFDRMARGLHAPIVILSATPNYNDIERCYCIEHVLDPARVAGGYLNYIYQRCLTSPNPFGMMPIVNSLIGFATAADYLSQVPNVHYVEDDLVYTIQDIFLNLASPPDLVRFGIDHNKRRMVASQMEMKHVLKRDQMLTSDETYLAAPITQTFINLLTVPGAGPTLVYSQSSVIARAAFKSLQQLTFVTPALVTGTMKTQDKEDAIDSFRIGATNVLIGTATLATGTDGLNRICDNMIILDDTEDDSLRRQLIGRIMPRGGVGDALDKTIIRLNP